MNYWLESDFLLLWISRIPLKINLIFISLLLFTSNPLSHILAQFQFLPPFDVECAFLLNLIVATWNEIVKNKTIPDPVMPNTGMFVQSDISSRSSTNEVAP